MPDYERPGRVLQIMAVLEQYGNHHLNMKQTAEQIDDMYHPQQQEDQQRRNFYHWVMCDKKGKVDVYHVSDCNGGESCELFQYLSEGGNMEKHLQRDKEYEVVRNDDGKFEFSTTSKTGSDIIKSTPRKSTQGSLL